MRKVLRVNEDDAARNVVTAARDLERFCGRRSRLKAFAGGGAPWVQQTYPRAKRPLITADSGGRVLRVSTGYGLIFSATPGKNWTKYVQLAMLGRSGC